MQRENQLIVSAAFFRAFLGEDAAGLDMGLANLLFETLAEAGLPPAQLQLSCAFGPGGRAVGRWLFVFSGEEVSGPQPGLRPQHVYQRLLGLAELPGDTRGADALCGPLDPAAVSGVALGFDASLDPADVRVRCQVNLRPGEAGAGYARAVLGALRLSPEVVPAGPSVSELAVENGPRGLTDLRLAAPVDPRALAANASVRAQPCLAAMIPDAEEVRLVRSLRRARDGRLVFVYGDTGEGGPAQLTAWARRVPLVADLRRQVNVANRSLPKGTGLVMRPWGMTVGIADGAADAERFAVLLRPLPVFAD